jgi:hypothetical protein
MLKLKQIYEEFMLWLMKWKSSSTRVRAIKSSSGKVLIRSFPQRFALSQTPLTYKKDAPSKKQGTQRCHRSEGRLAFRAELSRFMGVFGEGQASDSRRAS